MVELKEMEWGGEKKKKLALHVLNNFLGILGSGHLVLGILR